MSRTVRDRELRRELSQAIDQVADLRERIIVTRRGRPAAALAPIDLHEATWKETADIHSDQPAPSDTGHAASSDHTKQG